jgi:hypothetical protein
MTKVNSFEQEETKETEIIQELCSLCFLLFNFLTVGRDYTSLRRSGSGLPLVSGPNQMINTPTR